MAKLPWFPFEATTWLSDSYVRIMTSQQRGWYIELLCWCWQEGGIDLNTAWTLAQVDRDADNCSDFQELKSAFESVLSHFTHTLPDGRVSHHKLEAFRDKAIKKSEKQSIAGQNTQAMLAAKLPANQALRASKSISNSSSEDLNKKNSESSLPPDLRSMQTEWFNAFWRGYWRRVGRGAAEKSFKQAVKTPEQFERVIQALELQSPWMMARDSDKRPYPATWLNQKRWEDEPDVVTTNGTRQLTRSEQIERAFEAI